MKHTASLLSLAFWLALVVDTRGAIGGGDGSGDGASGQKDDGDGDAKFLTREGAEELFNKMLGGRFRDFEAKLAKTLDKRDTDAVAKLTEVLDAKLAPLKEQQTPGPDGKKADTVDLDAHPAFKAIKRQLDEQTQKAARLETERKTERGQRRDATLRQKLLDALSPHGIEGARASHAVGFLVDTRKAVRYADDEGDKIVFRDDDAEYDLTAGLKTWVDSDEGKLYSPPRDTKGSGEQGGSKKGPKQSEGNGLPSKAEIGSALSRLLVPGSQ